MAQKRGTEISNSFAKLIEEQKVGVRGKQKLRDPPPGFRTHRRKHAGIVSDMLKVLLSSTNTRPVRQVFYRREKDPGKSA
jgi:hypothetical protein